MILKKTNLAKHILVQCMSITTFFKKSSEIFSRYSFSQSLRPMVVYQL